jgi:hypothetical protein
MPESVREMRGAIRRVAHGVSFGGLGCIYYVAKPHTKGQTPRKGVASVSGETKRGDKSAIVLLDVALVKHESWEGG